MQTQPPFQARWIIDTMVIMTSVKSQKTYKEWLTALIKIIIQINTGIASPLNLFVTHTVQLVAKVVRAKKGENLVNGFI